MVKFQKTWMLFTTLTLLCVSGRANANTEEIVYSITGGAPYLLVVEDAKGGSKRDPGLYTRNTNGDWELALGGKVLKPSVVGGVGNQLAMTSHTNRYDSLSIIDGKLVIFSTKTNQNMPESFAVIGEGNYPVINPLDGSRVILPPIASSNDVTFNTSMVSVGNHELQLVLVSLKSFSPAGDGISFAFLLNPSANTGVSVKLLSNPILLDWKWLDQQQLGDRVIKDSQKLGFLSKMLFQQLSQPRQDDPLLVQEWRKQLTNLSPDKSKLNQGLLQRVPYLDAFSNSLAIDSLPAVSERLGNSARALAVYDPVYSKHGVYINLDQISLKENRTKEPLIHGVMTCDDNGCLRVETENSNIAQGTSDTVHVMTIDNGTTYLLAENRGQWDAIVLKPSVRPSQTIRDMAWLPVQGTNYIVVSWKLSQQEHTEVFELQSTEGGLRILASKKIASKFYDRTNLTLHIGEYNNQIHGFDVSTPIVKTTAEYRNLHKKTSAHIDIAASLQSNGELVEFYPEPLQRIDLGMPFLYLKYETASNQRPRMGIHLRNANGSEGEVVMGTELLNASGLVSDEPNGAEKTILGRANLQFAKNAAATVELSVIATDDRFDGGQYRFEPILLVKPAQGKEHSKLISLGSMDVPIKDLEFFHLIVPTVTDITGEGPRPIIYVYSVKGQGTFASALSMTNKFEVASAAHTTLLSANRRILTANEAPQGKELEARIRYDQSGNPLWIVNPDVAESHPGFKFINLYTQAIVNPAEVGGTTAHAAAVAVQQQAVPTWKVKSSNNKDKDTVVETGPEYKTDIFSSFRTLLDDLANPNKPARRVVLIVPPEVRKYAQNYPFVLRQRQEEKPEFWSEQNAALKLYSFKPELSSQEEVLENLVQLKEAGRDPRNRPLLLANIANLTQAKRPATHRSGKAFTLSEAQFGDLQVTGGATTYTVSNTSPHILYLVASEGDTLPLAKFAERKDKPTVSTLFIGTAAEWGELTSDAELENKYGLTDRYEVIKLDPPNFEMRKKFLVDFLSQPDVQALGYNVDVTSFDERKSAEDVSPDEARRMVASYFINTADRLAREGRLSPFDGFMKAANIFRSELQTNSVIRQSRKIDQGTLQTILSKVFPMVLNVHLLPDSDPLKKLQRPDTVFLWQKTGHPGSLTLKKEIIETVLRQLTPGSELPNRNSVLLIGDTGSGKTTLLTSLFGESVLNLRYYNFNASPTENQGAWVFYLSMSKIFDNGGATPANDMMTLDKALEHLDTFLSSANGHRGFIIFDDMHNAPPRVRSAFIQRHRQLLENKTYTTQLTRQGRYGATTTEQVTLPTRNITTFLIMNPTPDQKTVEKYTKGSKPTVEEMAVATLATNDHQAADIAFIKRFGLVRSFDVFPADAKVVQLINESVSVTKSTFDSSKVVNFVNTDAIQQVVNKFPTTDGRTFASAALSRLIKLDLDGGRIVIAVPKIQNIDGGSAKLESMDYAPSEDADVKIQRFVEENIVHLDIENSVRGRIEFLRYMLESTRKRAYETILKALADDERFVVGDNQVMASVTARALADHLDTIPQFPMENLVLEPYQVGADSGTERSAYSNTLQYIRQNQNLKKYPQIGLAPVPDMWSRYSGESSTTVNSRTRQHVLKETVDQLTAILQAFTSDLFRVADVGRLPKPEDWLKQIGEIKTDPLLAKKHGPAFLNQLINYTIEIFNRRLLEVQKESGNAQLTQYDSARMYALALDKALGQLPWGSITMFMVSSLQLASLDSTLGQSVGMQHFMFDSKVSPLMSVDKSFVLSNAKSMPFYETIGGSDASRLGRRFDDSCALWLSSIEDRKLR